MLMHKRIQRTAYRIAEEIRATMEIAKSTSWEKALATFFAKIDIQRMNRRGSEETHQIRTRLLKKHQVMLEYFEDMLSNFLEEYDYNRQIVEDDHELHNRIWVCWWQGWDNAPTLVRACIASIQKNAGDHVVTLITEENYEEYVNIPDWVKEKHSAGVISHTNFSDLLRLSLLAEHGGLWLDATFFVAKDGLADCFADPIWSIKRPDYGHASVASGYFAGYSLRCTTENRWMFATMRDFFLYYWKENDFLVDYLLIDYMIVLAQKKDPRIGKAFENIKPNNPKCDELLKILKDPYDEKIWNDYQRDTRLYKLSWKQNYPLKVDNKDTFYSKLVQGEL